MKRTHFRWLAAGVSVLLAGQPAAAQLKIAYAPEGETANLQVIALRPNVAQPIYFKYYNPGPGVKKNVKIKLEQVFIDDKTKEIKTKEIAKTVIAKVDPKKDAPVSFAASMPAPKDPAAPWPKLDGPPFAFRFSVDDGAAKELTIDVPVKLQEPRDYVHVRDASYDPIKKRLSFKLGSDEGLDPPCPVALILQPSSIQGLVPNAEGTFNQKLSKENREVELSATNVEFEGGLAPQNGRIYLTIDGFERAYLYKCAFAQGTLKQLKDDTRARLVAPRYALPSTKIPVVIEIDSKSQVEGDEDTLQRSLVEVKFDRAGQGSFEMAIGSPFRGLRDQAIEYKADGDALLFKTKVKDRLIELDTEGINGPRMLQVRLLSSTSRIIPIANEQDTREEKVALFDPRVENKFAPLTFDRINDTVAAELILDSTPAEEMKIAGVPAKARPEERVKPRLTLRQRTVGVQAPLDKIVFFFGEADKDHKPPEKANKFEAMWDKVQNAYVPKEEMLVPTDKLGKLFVSAQVETATGVLMSKKQPLTVISKDAILDDPDVLTTITGAVMRSTRPQPDVTVFLAKVKPDKDDETKQAKTNDKGQFEFAEVKPGRYVISARRLNVVDSTVVTVPKNKERISGVELKLTTK